MVRGSFRRLWSRLTEHRRRSLSNDTSGNVLPMMAIGFVVLAALVGSGVDMSRAYKAQRRLQAACDAGVLAGRRAVTTHGFDETVQSQAETYFSANFDDDQQQTTGTDFIPSSDDDGATVSGTATTRMSTVIMKIFGFADFDLAVDCSASMGVGNSDIMFVLDNTGSMAEEPNGTSPEEGEDSKLQSLQAAMKEFYETVQTSVAGSNARIRYGFVPYSSAVNVGHLLSELNPAYIANSVTVQSLKLVNWNATPIKTWTESRYTDGRISYGDWEHHSGTGYGRSSSCNNNKPADTTWADSSATYIDSTTGHKITYIGKEKMTDYECRQSGGWRDDDYYIDKRTATRDKSNVQYEERIPIEVTANNTAFANAVLQQRTFDTSSYKAFNEVTLPIGIDNSYNPDRTSNVTSTWAGCIIERQTTPASSFSFVSLATGITPSDAMDLNIDAAPTSEATKWSPLWPEVTFDRDNDVPFEDLDDDGDGNITTSGRRNEKDDNTPSTYCPQRAQQLEVMDEEDFDDYADSLVAVGSTYHDIGMLWGARLSSPTGIWSSVVNKEPDNGGTVSRHLIFMTDGKLEPSLTVNSSYGIEYLDKRITGNGDDDDQYDNHMARFLAICEAVKARGIRLWVIAFGTSLTDELVTCATDGLASAFQAADADELNEHFQEIANQVGELRVTQ